MVDVLTKAQRQYCMSQIQGKNTRPELVIRNALYKLGYRYKLHDRKLPGKPDLVFPKYHAVIFINGCFWHGHNCHLFKWPSTRPDFWANKILRNKQVDNRNYKTLKKEGWYILTIWECAIKGRMKKPVKSIIDLIIKWLEYENKDKIIKG